jgi:hypothetical protein
MLKTFTNLPVLTFFLSSMRNRWRAGAQGAQAEGHGISR